MKKLKVPEPDLQITFYQRLEETRRLYLLDALLDTVARLDIGEIDGELGKLVSPAALRRLAGWGLRGEIVFAVPSILAANPRLLGYYRLLLGFSQKQFYGSRYEFGPFKSMETRGVVTAANGARLLLLCEALCWSGSTLVKGVSHLSRESVHDLTLLTLGPQLRGGVLNTLGSTATKRVFDLIHSFLAAETVAESERSLSVQNAAGRTVKIEFAADPDICIREELPSGRFRNLVAIEIKGGRDYSNVHNRIGEAEKSHQKAKKDGFAECWTIVGVADLGLDLARKESPTTDRFYHLDEIEHAASAEAGDFRESLISRLGIRA
jgi:hypothetical protein